MTRRPTVLTTKLTRVAKATKRLVDRCDLPDLRDEPWAVLLCVALLASACNRSAPAGADRATGYVEATEVRVAAEVGGRLVDVTVAEGDRVSAGDVIAERPVGRSVQIG